MFTFFIIHSLVCLLYYYLSFFWIKPQERFCRLLIALTLPVFGLMVLTASDLVKGKKKALDPYQTMRKGEGVKLPIRVRLSQNKDAVSLEEVLIVNNNLTKRRVLLEIFKENPERYIKELKLALNDPDTETSHYASAALMEIKRKLTNSISRLSKLLSDNPEDMDVLQEYLALLNKYIDSDILDTASRRKLQTEYCSLAQAHLEQKNRALSPKLYQALVLYVFVLGHKEKAKALGRQLIDLYPEYEQPYFASMQVAYDSGEYEELKAVIELLKNSSVILSKPGLNRLRFFLGGY